MAVTISGSGQIIKQVIQSTYSSSISTSSATPSATALTANITPTSTSNKILVQLAGGAMDYGGTTSGNSVTAYIYRNGTQLAALCGMTYGNPYGVACAGIYIDSPSTTSSTTYTIYIASTGGVTGYLLNSGSTLARPINLTLMEVSGA